MKEDISLKKAGIRIIKNVPTIQINKIASIISEKIATAFPDHKINKSELFAAISRINMYIAEFQDNSAAKYCYYNNTIYFQKNIPFKKLLTPAIHECIHFIQTVQNSKGNVERLGLYTISAFKEEGCALNEAAVQLMASKATNSLNESVKYYEMNFRTISPNYYPIECALIRQMAYFTGSYPLYHSVFYSDNIFKHSFITKSSEVAFNTITYNLDKLVKLQGKLEMANINLAYTKNDKDKNIIRIQKNIQNLKKSIRELTIETQEIILTTCIQKDFQSIRTEKDISQIQSKLYKFKNILISSKDYTFYNEYYRYMMESLEEKRILIKKYGILNNFQDARNNLALIEVRNQKPNLIEIAIDKIKKLFHIDQEEEEFYNMFK